MLGIIMAIMLSVSTPIELPPQQIAVQEQQISFQELQQNSYKEGRTMAAPNPPYSLYATNIAQTSITAVWYCDSTATESQIQVFSCDSGGGNQSFIADIPNITRYQEYCSRNLSGGFTAGNWFLFKVRTGNPDGVSAYVSSSPFQMQSSAPSAPNFTSYSPASETSFTVYFTKGTNASYTNIELYDSNYNYLDSYSTTYNNRTIGGLDIYTSYYVRGQSVNEQGVESGWTGYFYCRTGQPAQTPPVFTSYTSTGNSLTVNWNMGTNATLTEVKLYDLNNTLLATELSGGTSHTFSGLTEGTTYYVKGKSTNYYGESATTSAYYCSTMARPSNFAWTNTFTSGEPVYITVVEWNAFTAKINAFRNFKGLSQYSFTPPVAGTDITATTFNQAVNAISDMRTMTNPAAVFDTPMQPSYFTQIVTDLNGIT